MEDNARNMKVVYTVVERGQPNGLTKSYWTRVGVGFVNRDGSITLRLDCIPLSGTLQVREWEPYERRSDAAEPAAPGGRRPASHGEAAGAERPTRAKVLQERTTTTPGESLL